jgi:uncharacterized protein HemX
VGEDITGIARSGEMNAEPERVMKTKKDNSNLYGVLILLIVLLVGGGGFFFLQQLRSEQAGLGGALDKGDRRLATLGEQLATLERQISTLQSQMATMQNGLTTRESKFERELSDFKEHQSGHLAAAKSELASSIGQIQEVLNRTRGDWMIADAEYLLSVANQRLNLTGDIKTTLVALQAADERLRDSGNPGVFKVREQLAREIDALKGLQPVDIVGVFSKIRALDNQVDALPVYLPHVGVLQETKKPEKEVKTDEKAEEITGVDEFLDSAIEDLKGLVVVRRSDRKVDVVLLPEEVRVLREGLKIRLNVTRMALLERDSRLFLYTIDDIQSWLNDHFRLDAAETKKFEAELASLRKVGLDIEYPDVSGSLKLLQNLASLRVQTEQSVAPVPAPRPPETPVQGEPPRKPEGAQQ